MKRYFVLTVNKYYPSDVTSFTQVGGPYKSLTSAKHCGKKFQCDFDDSAHIIHIVEINTLAVSGSPGLWATVV